LYPSQLSIKAFFDKLTGDGKIKEMILAGEKPENIINYWQGELNDFKKIRKQYLIY
jgi:beta-N-acetylhexosaminidase